MRARIVLLLIVLAGMWGIILSRAAFLQLLPNDRLKSLQKRQFETVVTLNPRRGDVVDRNGHELAVSMQTYSLFADPKIIEAPRQVAKKLAKELRVSVGSVDEKLRMKKKRFVWIGRQLPKPTRDAIVDMKVHGLGFIEESQRIYPNDKLLSQVLGFVGEDGQGLEGLELKYNDHLQATSRKVSIHRDARGRPLIVNGQVFNQVPDGADIELTIDREMQFILEQELHEAVREHDADSAVGVVLDAQTSEILAMGSAPTFDPNHAGEYAPDHHRDRAITDSFEPGSVMKTMLIAGAIARGDVKPDTKFDCQGGIMHIGKRVIHEAEVKDKFGELTVSQILAYSSNVGATKIAFKMGEDQVRETLKTFGFGEKTGVDLPGEVRGIIQPMPWREHLLANVAFGHGMTATPLQIANAYASIADGGFLHQPSIVRSIKDHETGEMITFKPKTIRRVLNDQQVAEMKTMLTGVTSGDGTGINARVPGFPVAGKTGTAQKVNPNGHGYLKGGYVASFAGFLPANDPRFVIYVAIDHPRKGYYGAAVAAPVFSRIAQFAVRRAGLAPVLLADENKISAHNQRLHAEPIIESQVMPQNMALTVPAVVEVAIPNLKSQETVTTVPDKPLDSKTPVLPDLAGLSLREVLSRVNGSEIQVRVKGQGFVTHTSPLSGAKISDLKELTVYLEE